MITALRPLPCVHRGGPNGQSRPCTSCTRAEDVPLYACGRHGVCALDRQLSGVQCCRICPDRTEGPEAQLLTTGRPVADGPDRPVPVSAAAVPELLAGLPDPLPEPPLRPVPDGWACRSSVRQRHAAALHELAGLEIPPADRAEGDGVLVCGGGRYWPGIVVAVRMLREVSALPVQIWYRGGAEKVDPDDLAGVEGVTYHDASKLPHRLLGGWEIKTLALLHCGLRRVLYLDADAYCVADPAPLLDLASERRFVFWHDLPSQNDSVGWKWFGIVPEHGTLHAPVPVQGGQLAIDLVGFRRELVLAHWLNQHSDYSYHHPRDPKRKHEWHCYGDQDCWRVALALTGGRHLCLGAAAWEKPAFVCSHEGKPLVVHRCQGKLLWEGKDDRTTHLPGDDRVNAHLDAYLRGDGTPAKVFGRIYERGAWGHGDRSGGGSTPKEAAPYLDVVNGLVRVSGWKRVVDLGCGDGLIASRVEAPEVYGVDVYSPHLDRLRRQHPGKQWLALDLDADRERLPAGDACLVKDLFQHHSSAFIRDWIAWAAGCGKWQWVVIANDFADAKDGADTTMGGYRPLDADLFPLKGLGLRRLCRYLHKEVLVLECDRKEVGHARI